MVLLGSQHTHRGELMNAAYKPPSACQQQLVRTELVICICTISSLYFIFVIFVFVHICLQTTPQLQVVRAYYLYPMFKSISPDMHISCKFCNLLVFNFLLEHCLLCFHFWTIAVQWSCQQRLGWSVNRASSKSFMHSSSLSILYTLRCILYSAKS